MKMVRFIAKIGFFLTRKTKMLTGSMLKFNTDHASVRTGFYLKNNPEINKEVQDPSSNIIWGTIDSWILWNLTGGEVHATDYSNISTTGLLDPFTLKWNSIVLKAFKIPKHILPEIKETGDDFGSTTLFGSGIIKITAVQADQQASLFGQCTGNEPKASKRKLYPLIAWRLNGETTYLLEGVSHNTGNIIDWIQKELGLYKDPSETESMALSVNSTNGVYFLPTFSSGISYPYWDHTAKGNIFGISLDTKKEHIVRAVLEGISYRIKDIVEGIIADINISVEKIKVDGGVSKNKFFLQFLCDILGTEVEHSQNPETTALGVTFMAGLVTGFWNSKEELMSIRKIENIYKPQINEQERKIKASYWNDIIKRSLNYRNY
jgi:glycerol kinase